MTRIALSYVATLIVFAIVDFVWLKYSVDILYRPVIGSILAPEPRMAPAIIFYALYIAGLVYFAVTPALNAGQWQTAAIQGALFGFFAYATYDLTNQATLVVWSSKITIADMIWGSFVSAVGSTGGYLVTKAILKG
ncbi:DUF2177 family protein [Rhizorhabdus sp. FW153]|uniref:DUF2177 family protein n=1 Tax=Rhizorhabdus sp. FW153 TaxID=3400216 RepID=UPI003CF4CB9B